MPLPPSAERHNQLIAKYYVPHMGDYSAVGGYLSLILERLDVNRGLSSDDKQFIRNKGLFDLFKFVKTLEETGKPDFRILSTKFERQQNIRIRKELWDKYDIGYVDRVHMGRMMDILRSVEKSARLSGEDALWLATNTYFFPSLKREFHKNEAMFYRQSFEESDNPWDAVNSSSHYRKANLASEAVNLLLKVDIDSQQNKLLRSALCTTKGGAKRDLKKFDEAFQLATDAHLSNPRSFHPCTLLGALNYDQGNYSLGDEWFAKAIERGANREDVDHEIRSIFRRASKAQKDELKRHLLNIDLVRYGWVSQTKGGKKTIARNT